eukprot:10333435-Alexandrium_andersonii.AAC.1
MCRNWVKLVAMCPRVSQLCRNSASQCVAILCRNVSQCVAVCRNVSQVVAMCRNMWQCVAICRNMVRARLTEMAQFLSMCAGLC